MTQKNSTPRFEDTIKGADIEEWVDLVFYRRLSFVLVRRLARFQWITPNRLTLFALCWGILAAWFFHQGQPNTMMLGSIALFIWLVLDCMDGQLARFRKTSSMVGYVLDGVSDYIVATLTYVSIVYALNQYHHHATLNWWWLGGTAGACFAWGSAFIDQKRAQWQQVQYGPQQTSSMQLGDCQKQMRQGVNQSLGERIALKTLWIYLQVWTRCIPNKQKNNLYPLSKEQQQDWLKFNRPVIRIALWLGPSTQFSLLIILCFMNQAAVFLWLLIGTSILLIPIVLIKQHRNHAAFKRLYPQ